jgi:hypothetical protein
MTVIVVGATGTRARLATSCASCPAPLGIAIVVSASACAARSMMGCMRASVQAGTAVASRSLNSMLVPRDSSTQSGAALGARLPASGAAHRRQQALGELGVECRVLEDVPPGKRCDQLF